MKPIPKSPVRDPGPGPRAWEDGAGGGPQSRRWSAPANDALKNNDGEGKLKADQQIRDFVDFLVRAWGSGASQNWQRRKKKRSAWLEAQEAGR